MCKDVHERKSWSKLFQGQSLGVHDKGVPVSFCELILNTQLVKHFEPSRNQRNTIALFKDLHPLFFVLIQKDDNLFRYFVVKKVKYIWNSDEERYQKLT